MAANGNNDSQESLTHFPQIFPSVHESEVSERNKNRSRCSFSQFLPKKIRRRQSTCSDPVNSSTGCVRGSAVADEFGDSQALEPRSVPDLLLVKYLSFNPCFSIIYGCVKRYFVCPPKTVLF